MTDLPGTLRNFWGDEGQGTWQLTMVDNALSAVGRIEALSIRLEPTINTNDNEFSQVTILPNRWFFNVVDVPRDAISLKIDVIPDPGDVDVYVGRNYIPDDVIFDYYQRFSPPGGTLEITPASVPPLSAGLYFIGLRNPNSFPITVRLRIRVERDLTSSVTNIYKATGPIQLLDDAVTTSLIGVTNSQEIVDLRVGVRIAHERAFSRRPVRDVLHTVFREDSHGVIAEAGIQRVELARRGRVGAQLVHASGRLRLDRRRRGELMHSEPAGERNRDGGERQEPCERHRVLLGMRTETLTWCGSEVRG